MIYQKQASPVLHLKAIKEPLLKLIALFWGGRSGNKTIAYHTPCVNTKGCSTDAKHLSLDSFNNTISVFLNLINAIQNCTFWKTYKTNLNLISKIDAELDTLRNRYLQCFVSFHTTGVFVVLSDELKIKLLLHQIL